jgi:drug/metabolite transporter (DMT)-like permease
VKKAFLQLHVAVFLAGFTGILGRLIQLNEGWLVWYRLLITSATMWFWLMKKLQRVPAKDILKLSGIGLLAGLHWITFYGSIKYANVSVALVCFSSVGFFTALFEPFILKAPFKWVEVLLGIIVMAGIYIIFRFDPQYKAGIILGVISAILLAFVIIFLKQYADKYNPETILTYQLSGGFLAISAIMPIYQLRFPTDYFIPTPEDWAWLLVLAWICSVIAFMFSMYALKKLSAFTVNLTFNLEPVYGILLAFIIYKENQLLSRWFYVGFAMIALALIIHVMMVIREHSGKKYSVTHAE